MFTEDHSAFFELDGHAVAAVYQPSTGSATTINGIYNNEYLDEVGGMVSVEGSNPTFTCKSTDVQGVVQGEGITIDDIRHNIVNVQPDGTGQTVLILSILESNGIIYNLDFSKSYNSQYLFFL